MDARENGDVALADIVAKAPTQPHGHVNARDVARLSAFCREYPDLTLGRLAEINGLAARVLAMEPASPVAPPPPTGGTPIAMRMAA
jgi:hypothetical protein